jgi:opacity protein-like surface antigen
MKYLVMLLFLFLLPSLVCSVYAQKKLYAGYSIGISSSKWTGDGDKFAGMLTEGVIEGLNKEGFYNISGSDFENRSRIGFYFSVFTEQSLTKGLYLHPELSYCPKGTRYLTDDFLRFTYVNEDYQLDLKQILTYETNYVDLPIFFLHRFSKGKGTIQPFLEIGPQASVLVTSKMKVKVEAEGESDDDDENYDQIERFDYGLSIGGGLDIGKSKNACFRLEFRYQWGFPCDRRTI